MKNRFLEDTEQSTRMKQLALNNSAYMNPGELYRLLQTEILHNLIKKIEKGNVQLPSTILYGRSVITKEEKFLENLDKYITYVKENYYFNPIEKNLIIELSLENKYNEILFDLNDFHSDENYNIYGYMFRKMFLFNFYENIMYYSKICDENSNIYYISELLKNYKYDNKEHIKKIEKILSRVLYLRKDNIYNSYVYYKDTKKREMEFYANQLDWVLSNYFEYHQENIFDVGEDDYYINTFEKSIILFNIKNYTKNKNENIIVEFGIKNNNFSAKVDNVKFTVDEFNKLINRLKTPKIYEKYYEEQMAFLDCKLKFMFWSDRPNEECAEIEFHYNKSTEYFNVSLDKNDIKNLINIINKQLNNQ